MYYVEMIARTGCRTYDPDRNIADALDFAKRIYRQNTGHDDETKVNVWYNDGRSLYSDTVVWSTSNDTDAEKCTIKSMDELKRIMADHVNDDMLLYFSNPPTVGDMLRLEGIPLQQIREDDIPSLEDGIDIYLVKASLLEPDKNVMAAVEMNDLLIDFDSDSYDPDESGIADSAKNLKRDADSFEKSIRKSIEEDGYGHEHLEKLLGIRKRYGI